MDVSFRHHRVGAAPRNSHRNGELLHPGNPDKDLDEKAASKIAKYRELYRDHRRQLDFLPAIASTSGRIHCVALLSLTLSRARQVSWWRGLRRSGPTSTSTAARSRPRNGGELLAKPAPHISSMLVPPTFTSQ